MLCKDSLKSIFAQFLDAGQLERVSGFFQSVLEIGNASLEDLIEEIRTIKIEDMQDIDRIEMLYGYIAAAAKGHEDVQQSVRSVSSHLHYLAQPMLS